MYRSKIEYLKSKYYNIQWKNECLKRTDKETLAYMTKPYVGLMFHHDLFSDHFSHQTKEICAWYLYNAPGLDSVYFLLTSTVFPKIKNIMLVTVSTAPEKRLELEREYIDSVSKSVYCNLNVIHCQTAIEKSGNFNQREDYYMNCDVFEGDALNFLRCNKTLPIPDIIFADPPWLKSNGNGNEYESLGEDYSNDKFLSVSHNTEHFVKIVALIINNTINYIRRRCVEKRPIFAFKLSCKPEEFYNVVQHYDLKGYKVSKTYEVKGRNMFYYYYVFSC